MKQPFLFLILCFCCFSTTIWAQYTSIHHAENDFYRQFNLQTEAQYDSLQTVLGNTANLPTSHLTTSDRSTCTLQKEVYGFQPYWVGSSVYNNYDYHLLSTLCYFSYELNPSTGQYTDIHSWKTTTSINLARAAGCKIDLAVVNFGNSNNTTFLSNPDAWETLVDSLIPLLNYRQANGVNIDFEGIPSSQDDNFVDFITYLDTRLNAERPNTSISIDVFAVDWAGAFNVSELVPHVDRFIIMGYDYHYTGDAQAGPVAPLYSGTAWNMYTLNRSVNYYLNEGVPASKLILAVPYYGYDWTTQSANIPSNTTATGVSRTYKYVRDNFYNTYTRQWDNHSASPYFIYLSGGETRQCWYEDEISLAQRYDMILAKKLAGTGIWALGYDAGYNQLWNLLETKFTDCYNPCTGIELHDTGGSLGNYQNNESYTYTLTSPEPSLPVTISFPSFDIENNFDFLRIYDGSNTAAPLIGTYTGTANPGTITSTNNSLTLRFTSDNATVRPGFTVNWACGSCFPSANIQTLLPYYNNDFTATFEDIDACGNGFNGKFYQVVYEPTNSDWRANGKAGFFNDEFDNGILSADWGAATGTWIADEGVVYQINTAEDNTNLYAELTQSNGVNYLYNFRLKIMGSGTNRRAGFHFFADDGDAENRGNSYFVFFRVDGSKAQIYKVTNNVFDLVADNALMVNADEWYDIKVSYSPALGEIRVYSNNQQVATWTDPNPLTTGSFISLRTGNCEAMYDFVRTLKSRTNNNLSIKVGNANNDDILYYGNGVLPARVVSILRDNGNRWTNMAFRDTNIDIWLSATPTTEPAINATLYPNPADVWLNLRVQLEKPTQAQLQIIDLQGKIVQQQPQLYLQPNGDIISLPIQYLPAGQYIVRLQASDFVWSELLVVQ
ncbi:MAG: T9SS type A sorting domain-containing protein [Chitinophagales bacterium]|jgi:spore germination protein YaaH|nr:T9SS type A sorting domain-containing protein [Chitinophagales bacterium]